MNMRIIPTPLNGSIKAIASKSEAHRHLISAALSGSKTEVILHNGSEDICATIRCLRALGASIEEHEGILSLHPITEPLPEAILDCGESASTLRFLLPVAIACCERVHFTGCGRLPMRPLDDLLFAMGQNGVRFSSSRLPLTIEGRLQSGRYALPGNISSQYITGLLLALPLLPGDSEIHLTTELHSSAYMEMTLHILHTYGVRVHRRENGFFIPGNQRYHTPGRVTVNGDWSSGAFFLAAGAIGSPLAVGGLSPSSTQGDRRITDFLKQFGAEVSIQDDDILVAPKPLRGYAIDIGETPDLLPPLATVAAYAAGETRFFNGARLRLKESNRLQSTAALICSLGGHAEETPDGLIVSGRALTGGSVDCFHDHRIAMAASIAAIACKEPVTIFGAEAVRKSYPTFFVDYQTLGGKAYVI